MPDSYERWRDEAERRQREAELQRMQDREPLRTVDWIIIGLLWLFSIVLVGVMLFFVVRAVKVVFFP